MVTVCPYVRRARESRQSHNFLYILNEQYHRVEQQIGGVVAPLLWQLDSCEVQGFESVPYAPRATVVFPVICL